MTPVRVGNLWTMREHVRAVWVDQQNDEEHCSRFPGETLAVVFVAVDGQQHPAHHRCTSRGEVNALLERCGYPGDWNPC